MKSTSQLVFYAFNGGIILFSALLIVLSLKDGWKKEKESALNADIAVIQNSIDEGSLISAENKMVEVRQELEALRQQDRIYSSFKLMCSIFMLTCAIGSFSAARKLNQPAQVNPCNPPKNPRTT